MLTSKTNLKDPALTNWTSGIIVLSSLCGTALWRDHVSAAHHITVLGTGVLLVYRSYIKINLSKRELQIILFSALWLAWEVMTDVFAQTISVSVISYKATVFILFAVALFADISWKIITISVVSISFIYFADFFLSGYFFFDNHSFYAAFAIIALPCAIWLLSFYKKTNQRFSFTTTLLIAIANLIVIIMAQSRASWVALFVETIAWLTLYSHRRHKIFTNHCKARITLVITLILSAVTILAAVLYPIRPSSADGRFLIYKTSWSIFKSAPVTGHGTFGFLQKYMTEQAIQLSTMQNAYYNLLADNPYRTFNLPLSLLVKGGIVELILAILVFGIVLHTGFNRHAPLSSKHQALFTIVLGLTTLSLFSYPFEHPGIFILYVLCGGLFANSWGKVKVYSTTAQLWKWTTRIVAFLLIGISLYYGYYEYKWLKASSSFNSGLCVTAIKNFESIYKPLSDNPLFLYNYAASLNKIGRYRESEAVRRRLQNYLIDYDTELLASDNLISMNQFVKAEYHLKKAHLMIPNRFMPLYGLLQIYSEYNHLKADSIAHVILTKPVKVPSSDVEEIKYWAKNWKKTRVP